MSRMSSWLRREIQSALENSDYNGLIDLWSKNSQVMRLLLSMTYDKEDVISWRAIEAIGIVAKAMSEKEPDDVRNLAGRLLWMMRDESGGIGWSAPEILGEIIRNNPELCTDLVPVLISFHEEQMLCSGVLWAIGRIAEVRRELVLSAVPMIVSYFRDPEPRIRGMAVWSFGKISPDGYDEMLRSLISDGRVVIIYDKGELQSVTIGELAKGRMDGK